MWNRRAMLCPLYGDALLAGFYINELLLRLTARGDANSEVYSCYSDCLAELASGALIARALRLFELRLLSALGYALELEHDAQ
jgi:DNA repair protein RecO (recombination protein O)